MGVWPVLGRATSLLVVSPARGVHSLQHRTRPPLGISQLCQCRHGSRNSLKDQGGDEEESKPTWLQLETELGRRIRPQDRWKYKGLVKEEKKKKPTEPFERIGLQLPKEVQPGQGMLFRIGPSQAERDEQAHMKKLAMVEHIQDPEVRQIALEELEKRQNVIARLDKNGLLEKMERLQALGQPNIPAKDGLRMLIIEPRVKADLSKKLRGTGEQRRNISEWNLRESCSLVDCTGSHYAAGRYILSVTQNKRDSYFNDRNLEEMECILEMECYDEIMINVPQLTVRQMDFLSSLWRCKVWDRFRIVLQIFKNNACTRVAKLQVGVDGVRCTEV